MILRNTHSCRNGCDIAWVAPDNTGITPENTGTEDTLGCAIFPVARNGGAGCGAESPDTLFV